MINRSRYFGEIILHAKSFKQTFMESTRLAKLFPHDSFRFLFFVENIQKYRKCPAMKNSTQFPTSYEEIISHVQKMKGNKENISHILAHGIRAGHLGCFFFSTMKNDFLHFLSGD